MQRSQTRRAFVRSAAASAAAAMAALGSQVQADEATSQPSSNSHPSRPERRKNVVLIVADDQRHDTIAALGNRHIQTPHLDRLTRCGFAFTGARCMGAQNPAVCVPARAMLHTGRSLFHAPENMGRLVTLGQALRGAGYETFHAGKWHNGTPAFVRSFSGGGNIFFGGMHPDQFKMPIHDFDPAGKYDKRQVRIGDKFSSELFTDAALGFLHSRVSSGSPFFLHVAFTSPHDPRTPPAPFSTMYDPAKMLLPVNWLPRHPFDNGELDVRDEKLAPMPRTEADTRRQLCDYYGMISSQDAQVGRIIAALEATGQLDDTLIVYTGDHGLSIGSHGLFGKQSVYEEAQRIPLILSGPGVPPGKTSNAMVYGFDIYPTICSLLGLPIPESVEGKSLQTIIAGAESAVRQAVFGIYVHQNKNAPPAIQQMVHDGQWKLLRCNASGTTITRLFDLTRDAAETTDRSGDPAAAMQLPRLTRMLNEMRNDYRKTMEDGE